MERTLLKYVDKKTIQARITSKLVKPMFFPNFFGLKKVNSLKWETLVGEKGAPIMADVISWDSAAPIKSREVIEKLSGDIEKIAIKMAMTESEINEYNDLLYKVQGRQDLKDLLDLVYKDTDTCYNGVRGRKEFLAFQLMSTGELLLNAQNNGAGKYMAQSVNYGVPDGNKTGAAVVWSNAESATPITDIKAKVKYAKEQGDVIKHIIMLPDQFAQLQNAAETKDMVKYYINNTDKMLITQDKLNEFLIANQLPPVALIDPMVRHESKNHKRTVKRCWEEHRVSFITEKQIGEFQHAPIAGENNVTKAVKTKQNDILVSKWCEEEPYREFTKAEANTWPVLHDPSELYLLRTNATTWS